jgi:hypothetical protein
VLLSVRRSLSVPKPALRLPKGLSSRVSNSARSRPSDSGHDSHFITFSCYHRPALLSNAQRRELFLKVLEDVRRRYQWGCHRVRCNAGARSGRWAKLRQKGSIRWLPSAGIVTKVQLPTLYLRNLDRIWRCATLARDRPRRLPGGSVFGRLRAVVNGSLTIRGRGKQVDRTDRLPTASAGGHTCGFCRISPYFSIMNK